MARRRIERLQGVQFCRRTTEIRSEVSRPPDLFRAASPRNREVSSLLLSGFGRAGATANASGHFSALVPLRFVGLTHSYVPSSTIELSHGGLCPHPPRNLRFLGFSFRCRLFGRTSLCTQRHSTLNRRRKPRPPRRRAVVSHLVPTRNATQRPSRHHGGADRVAPARQQLRVNAVHLPTQKVEKMVVRRESVGSRVVIWERAARAARRSRAAMSSG